MTEQPSQPDRRIEIQQKATKIAAEVSQAYENSRILFGADALIAIAQENVRIKTG